MSKYSNMTDEEFDRQMEKERLEKADFDCLHPPEKYESIYCDEDYTK